MILNDGFNTTIVFPGAGLTFIEKEVTPPAIDGGGPIDITAMRNVVWRTKSPKYLKTVDKMMVKVRYDPGYIAGGAVNPVTVNINVNRLITLNFPTLTNSPARTVGFMGYMNKFAPEVMKEGEEPLADAEFIPTMVNLTGQIPVEVGLTTT